MALKRKRGSSDTLYDFRQSTTPPISSTNAAESYLPFSAGEENERRKRKRTESFEKPLSLHFGDWSDSSDQATAPPKNKRRSEDHISYFSGWPLENHGLQKPLFSSLKVLPFEDQRAQTPPTPAHGSKSLEFDLEPVSEGSGSQERKRRRKNSFEKLPSLHLFDGSSSGQGQKVEDQITAATDETKQTSINTGPKRSSLSDQVYDSHQSTPSSTNAAENQLPVGASEELEIPVRKKRRSKGFEKLLSLKSISYGSDQVIIHERQIEDHISLQSIACSVDDPLEEPLSSEDLPSVDQQVQSPPASVQHCPVSPASAHSSIVDLTTEDDILSRYEVGKLLGEGGFGCVYEGKRLEDGLEVAVKIARKPRNMKYIHVPGHPSPVPLEIGLLLLVNKESSVPEIIQLLDWQDQPERYIMVMERPSPCKDLWDYMTFQGGFLSEDIARFIMAQVIKAAHTCCQRGVYHRDIKLENLLIIPETLEVKLIDFGCGDLLQDSGYKRFCGTPRYCPPEYYVDHKYHGKPATVWSLGVLLFMLVCGRYPECRDIELIDYGVWFEPYLSNECSHLIRSLLNESPSQRIDLGEILLHDWFKITKPTWRKL